MRVKMLFRTAVQSKDGVKTKERVIMVESSLQLFDLLCRMQNRRYLVAIEAIKKPGWKRREQDIDHRTIAAFVPLGTDYYNWLPKEESVRFHQHKLGNMGQGTMNVPADQDYIEQLAVQIWDILTRFNQRLNGRFDRPKQPQPPWLRKK